MAGLMPVCERLHDGPIMVVSSLLSTLCSFAGEFSGAMNTDWKCNGVIIMT